MKSLFKQKNKPNTNNALISETKLQTADNHDDELIAVISAAVAAYMDTGFRVVSLTESGGIVRQLRIGETNNPWVQYSRMKNVR